MKIAILLGLILSGNAFANTNFARPVDNWFCTADGIDHDGRSRQVSGDYKPTKRQAERSAVSRCNGLGLMGCRVASCFNMGAP